MRRQHAKLLIGLLIVAGSLLVTGYAIAQYGGSMTLKDSSGKAKTSFFPGESGAASATAVQADTKYELDFAQSPGVIIGSATSNDQGNVAVSFTIPTSASVGSATVTLQGVGTSVGNRSVTIQIVAAATPAPTAVLPVTGAFVRRNLDAAVTLLLLGLVLVLAVRVWRTPGGGPAPP
jgi:hypothetical protein